MGEWTDVTLGEVLTLQRGFDLPQRQRRPGPYPVVSSAGFTGVHDEFKVSPPGVVIGRYGSLGTVHWVHEPFWPLNTALWVKDFKGNDPRFISYLLKTVTVDGSAAAAVPGVNRNHLHKQCVKVPSMRLQRRIVALLSTLDELIEINERRIELLEDLARSFYREWFVRFRHPHDQHSDRFESELGMIPRGWTVKSLGEVAELRRQNVRPADNPDDLFEHFSIPAFDSGQCPKLERGEAIKSGKYKVDGPAVLLSKINPRISRVWLAHPRTENAIASTEFLVWRGTAVSDAWLWAFFTSEGFRGALVGAAGGTSTSHQRVKPGDIERHRVPVPPREVRQAFDSNVGPMLALAVELRDRNTLVAAIMAPLLPRLVTGQLDISDIDLGVLTPADPK